MNTQKNQNQISNTIHSAPSNTEVTLGREELKQHQLQNTNSEDEANLQNYVSEALTQELHQINENSIVEIQGYKPKMIGANMIATMADPNIKVVGLYSVYSLYGDDFVYVRINDRLKKDKFYSKLECIDHLGVEYQKVRNTIVEPYQFQNDATLEGVVGSNTVSAARNDLLCAFPKLTSMVGYLVRSFGTNLPVVEIELSKLKARSLTSLISQAKSVLASLRSFDVGAKRESQFRLLSSRDYVSNHLFGSRLSTIPGKLFPVPNMSLEQFDSFEKLPESIEFSENELIQFHTNPMYNDVQLTRQIGKRMMATSLNCGKTFAPINIYTFLGFYLYTCSTGLRSALLSLVFKLELDQEFIFTFTNKMINDAFFMDSNNTFIFSIKSSLLLGAPATFVISPRSTGLREEVYALEEESDAIFH